MSLIEENHTKYIRMANLSIVGSHSVNGVAELHSNILKETVFKDFHEMFPGKFNNKTNGITQRRWLKSCNPELSDLITEYIGDSWVTNLSELNKLMEHIDDPQLLVRWKKIKKRNKQRLANHLQKNFGLSLNANTMLEVHVKRIHEYKRQTLNILHIIALYNQIKQNPESVKVPRTVLFSGKAAPGYAMAKLIIKFITSVGQTINEDPSVQGKLKVLFIPNYSVTQAENIIPAADLSDQISTAGMEASGTGNMKLALNGALTVGTLDGANVEIMQEVGEENIFIFGLKSDEVQSLKQAGTNPRKIYLQNPELKTVLDMIQQGYFSPTQVNLFHPILENFLDHGDHYMVLADFQSFCDIQEKINEAFQDSDAWARKSIINVAKMGKFSSDRSISEYAKDIWQVPTNQEKQP
jgi:starch phosphorylase